MGKGSNSGGCKSVSHQRFKDRAKNRVDDLEGMFTDLRSARMESRTIDVALLEEQVHQMLREWKAELNEPSPASSLQAGSLGSFSSEIYKLLQLCEEEDDATSGLPQPEKAGVDMQKINNDALFQEQTLMVNQVQQEQGFQLVDQYKVSAMGVHEVGVNNVGIGTQLEIHPFDVHQEFEEKYYPGFHETIGLSTEDGLPHIPVYHPTICPPPSAFLGPKCALWDCPRPVQGWGEDYCSSFHAAIAPNEGHPSMAPVLRPGGIGLKDGLLFVALGAKAQGKDVGIPECEGAATAKSPWNAPDLFDISVLEGETIREWLFFDKPRRAFESGNRKQRSLPDYNGRGWHESRKQVVNEHGGLKRSYYMDPQPMKNLEWHLYEYELNKYDTCALYRLELKLADSKKNSKGKASNDTVAALQSQMGKLTAEFQPDTKRSGGKGRAKGNAKGSSTATQVAPSNEGFYSGAGAPLGIIDNLGRYYLT